MRLFDFFKKKLYIPIIVALVFSILIVVSGCSGNKNKLYDITHEVYTPDTIKFVTEKEKYSIDDTVIRYSITNVSDDEVWINSDSYCYELHKLVDGEWKLVGVKKDHFWHEVTQLIPSGETETREIKLEDYFYLPLEKGEYRIAVEGLVSNTFEIS